MNAKHNNIQNDQPNKNSRRGKARNRTLSKRAIILIVSSSLIALPFLIVGPFFLVCLALRGNPYDQSQPASVKANLENNFGFKFPENMQAFKGAHGLGPGVHPKPYVCIVRFATDPNGLAQLRDSLSKAEGYSERLHRTVYKASVWRDGPLLLVIAVESEQGDKIDVYMEAVGGDHLRVEQEKSD